MNLSQVAKEMPLSINSIPIKTGVPRSLMFFIIGICFVCILSDGYDLGIYGAVVPSLLEYQPWGLTKAEAGAMGSYALFGMFFGAIIFGTISDFIGRKWTMIVCITLFTATMAACALAPTPFLFGLFRFIGGIGLGGIFPTASALVVEYSPPHRRSLNYVLMFSGHTFGTVMGAILAILLLDSLGWRAMFWIGALPLLIVPVMIKFLPESVSFLLSRNRQEEAEGICNRYHMDINYFKDLEEQRKKEAIKEEKSLKGLFSKDYRKATIFVWLTYMTAFYMVYGLNTWLPQIMRELGYSLSSSLSFLLIMNLTAAIGAIIAGLVADRVGSKRIIATSFFAAAVCAFILTLGAPPIGIVYLLIGITGFGSIGITQLVNAFVTKYYPAQSRGTALGWGLGIGRIGAISGPILVGFLLSQNVNLIWSFYTFVFAGLIAAVSMMFIPNRKDCVL